MLLFPAAPSKIPSSGILAAVASLPLPDRNGRKLVVNGGEMECGALPADCAPVKMKSPLEIKIF